jgi:hypothetical protein
LGGNLLRIRMNAVEDVFAEDRRITVASAGISTRLYRIPLYTACSLLAVLITFILGKDLPWDTLNYHFYAGFSALHDRFAQDYFAAGPESYNNPYAYVPFYALVTAGLSPLQISAILAVVQSGILWLTYEMATGVCFSYQPRRRLLIGLCAVALALANPILIQELGSSFADITTGELVLGGWLLLAGAVKRPRVSRVLLAGLIIGAATGLKPTNAVHALAAAVILLFIPVALSVRFRAILGYGLALVIGFGAVEAPWSYRLERTFGNPVFPLLNSIFRSPEFTTERLLHYRFIPSGVVDALLRPFEIIRPMAMVQDELQSPDLRYALLVVLSVVLLAGWMLRHFRLHGSPSSPGGSTDPSTGAPRRMLWALGCGLAVDWGAWLIVSGNGRYFIPMACVTAVIVIGLMFHLLARCPKVLGYVLAVIFVVQGMQLAMGSEFRWNAQGWDDHWLGMTVPKRFQTEPNLYFSLGVQSNSFLAPYLAGGSGIINLSGSYAISPTGASGRRVSALINRYSPHLRMLVRGSHLYDDNEHLSPRRSLVNAQFAGFGLHVDESDCQTIVVNSLEQDLQLAFNKPQGPQRRTPTKILSCHLAPGALIPAAQVRAQSNADEVLSRLEDACPRLFQPRGLQSQPFGRDGWMRYYINTDEMAWVSRGWLKFDDPVSGDGVAFLGREEDWLRAPPQVICGRRDGHYYAKILAKK